MKRILLKISGEALSSDTSPIDSTKATKVAQMLQDIKRS